MLRWVCRNTNPLDFASLSFRSHQLSNVNVSGGVSSNKKQDHRKRTNSFCLFQAPDGSPESCAIFEQKMKLLRTSLIRLSTRKNCVLAFTRHARQRYPRMHDTCPTLSARFRSYRVSFETDNFAPLLGCCIDRDHHQVTSVWPFQPSAPKALAASRRRSFRGPRQTAARTSTAPARRCG